MTERYHRSSVVGDSYMNPTKMENDFTPKKTMIIMVIVVACFAVLWPKIFYPMLVGSANQQIKPSAIDKTTGCCYVLSETDVDTIKIMSELCGEIIKQQVGVAAPLSGRQIINICQDEVYRTCGIDVSMVLQEQVRLGHTTKQILDEIRSLNGSLCLKYNFGVQPWRLGVPHIVTLRNVSDSVRQERSPLVRSEMIHPAFRERGRAIPQAKPTRPHPKIIDGMPGPLPGMRPTMGGPGHMVPPSKQQGSGSMGIIMPIYTIGIVIFFTYTLMKIICKKHPETDTIYSKMDLDPRFRKEMLTENGSRGSRDAGSCKLVVNAMSALLEEVDQEIEARRGSSEVAQEECLNAANLSNGSVKKDEKPSVKIMAMETSESCEDGKKWQSANSSVLPSVPQPVIEHVDPPKEIYLDRTLPAQSQILVADSATETEKNASNDDTAVVLAGKMTLSLISLENEELEIGDILNVKSNETKEAIDENKPILEEEINHIIQEAIECIDSSSPKTEIVPKEEVEANVIGAKKASSEMVTNDMNNAKKNEPEELITEIIEKESENIKKVEENIVPKTEQEEKLESGDNIDSIESKRTEAAPSDLIERHQITSEVPDTSKPSSRNGKPLLNSNTKSSSEDSGSSVLSGSNQGSVINVPTRSFEDDTKEEEEEISEEESDVEYEEEEIEVSEEEENEDLEVQRERLNVQSGEMQNQNGGAGLLNGVLTHNGDPEAEESEEEEVIEEIIEEYSDDEENLELNSN